MLGMDCLLIRPLQEVNNNLEHSKGKHGKLIALPAP